MSKIYKNNFQVLLIGNLGQLGLEIEKFLHKYKYNYKVLNRNRLDLSDFKNLKKYLSQNNFDLIINCAAFTNVDLAEKEKDLATKLNADLPEILSLDCKFHNTKLIHFSTDFIFNGSADSPYTENDLTGPLNTYGLSKLKGEQNIINVLDNYIILRVSGVFGNTKNNFIYKIIEKLQSNKNLKVVDDQISTPTSTNFISYLIEIILKLILNNQNFSGIYHAVPRGSISKYHLAKHVKNLMSQKKIKIINKELIPIKSTKINSIAKRPLYSVLGSSLLEKKLQIKFEDWSYYGNLKIMELLNEKY